MSHWTNQNAIPVERTPSHIGLLWASSKRTVPVMLTLNCRVCSVRGLLTNSPENLGEQILKA